jgi:hypothetical protein
MAWMLFGLKDMPDVDGGAINDKGESDNGSVWELHGADDNEAN